MAELARAPAAGETNGVKAPSLGLLLLEGRALGELATTYAMMPLLRRGPRGDGHPVLVLPGFLASDVSTRPLRRFLKERGYATHSWNLGRNLGPRPGVEHRLMERMQEIRQRHDRKVSLIGWSLGGVYARLLANRSPEDVRCVITLGTPFNANPKANNSWKLFEWVSGTRIDEVDPETFRQIRETPPVPTSSIYSRSDGVTSWRCCVDEEGPLAENIQVRGSHCGLGANPLVLRAVLDRLAQAEGSWRRFERSGLMRLLYRRPRGPARALASEG
ncbi:MAG: alpha/beta hydrolase [bacterium]|nr:alpha/beta hydrolase [bacterium]